MTTQPSPKGLRHMLGPDWSRIATCCCRVQPVPSNAQTPACCDRQAGATYPQHTRISTSTDQTRLAQQHTTCSGSQLYGGLAAACGSRTSTHCISNYKCIGPQFSTIAQTRPALQHHYESNPGRPKRRMSTAARPGGWHRNAPCAHDATRMPRLVAPCSHPTPALLCSEDVRSSCSAAGMAAVARRSCRTAGQLQPLQPVLAVWLAPATAAPTRSAAGAHTAAEQTWVRALQTSL